MHSDLGPQWTIFQHRNGARNQWEVRRGSLIRSVYGYIPTGVRIYRRDMTAFHIQIIGTGTCPRPVTVADALNRSEDRMRTVVAVGVWFVRGVGELGRRCRDRNCLRRAEGGQT